MSRRWVSDSANAEIRSVWQLVYGALNDTGLISHAQGRAHAVDVVLAELDSLGVLRSPTHTGGE